MNAFLTTPKHKNKIGYWVSNMVFTLKKVKIKYVYIKNSEGYKHSLSLIYKIKCIIKLTLLNKLK